MREAQCGLWCTVKYVYLSVQVVQWYLVPTVPSSLDLTLYLTIGTQ